MRGFNPAVDDLNWRELFQTHFQCLQSLNAISTLWISGFSKMGANHDKRPTAAYLSDVAAKYTGYEFIQTDQNIILDQIDWYRYIADFKMPLTSFVRTPAELEYCDEPDLWHDIMGHIPFLLEGQYSDMYQTLASKYISAYESEDKDVLRRLDFIGGILIELGLIVERSGIKALGATFYSSSEVKQAYKATAQVRFDPRHLDTGEVYDRHRFQGLYYVLPSWQSLVDAIHIA